MASIPPTALLSLHAGQDARTFLYKVLRSMSISYVSTHLRDTSAQRAFATQCVAHLLTSKSASSQTESCLDLNAVPDESMSCILDVVRARLPMAPEAELTVLYAVVLAAGECNPNWYRWLLTDSPHTLVQKLIHNIWAGHYASQANAAFAHDSDTCYEPALPLPHCHHLRTERRPLLRHGPAGTKIASSSTESLSRHILVCVDFHAIHILYEILCSVRWRAQDMRVLTPHFVDHLFVVMETSDSSEYSAQCMRVILALHDQCMMSTYATTLLPHIEQQLNSSKTCSENLVFLLNRTPSTTFYGCRFHLLVLKLLGAIFCLPETASYFYVNDLKVLVDIFLRELSDLPDAFDLLRQAYLCVFHALLTQTQLCTEPYKRTHITRLLTNMVYASRLHDTSERTLALAEHCLNAEWCVGFSPDGATLVAPIRGGEARVASLTKEYSEDRPHFHAEPSDASIQHMLILMSLQSTAASIMCTKGAYNGDLLSVMWPEFEPPSYAEAAAHDDTLAQDLDVLSLESWTSQRRPSVDSTQSADGKRRRPPPPRPPRPAELQVPLLLQLTSASMPDLHADSSSSSVSPASSSHQTRMPHVRRRAPDIPPHAVPAIAATAAPLARAHSSEDTSAIPSPTLDTAALSAPASSSLRHYVFRHWNGKNEKRHFFPKRLFSKAHKASMHVEYDVSPAGGVSAAPRRRAPPPPTPPSSSSTYRRTPTPP